MDSNNSVPEPFEELPQDVSYLQDGREVKEPLDVHPMTHTAASTIFEDEERGHEAGKRDVELYIRTYNMLLRSSGEISLKVLVQAHYNIDSSLHPGANGSMTARRLWRSTWRATAIPTIACLFWLPSPDRVEQIVLPAQ